MTKILVLGGSGMLGHKMFEILGTRFDDVRCTLVQPDIDANLTRTGLFDPARVITGFDACDPVLLKAVLEEHRPEVVVNCIGVIKQRPEAEDSLLSITINSLLPHVLADVCRPWNGRVIHFSTDCVFSGRTGSYTEASFSDAEDLYGKSKYLGEVKAANALTLRTSIIGHELKSFASLLDWFVAQAGGKISGYRKVMYSGVTTNYLARLVGDLISDHPGLSGLYQVAGDPIAKFDLLHLVNDSYGLDVTIDPEDTTVNDRTMNGNLFTQTTGLQAPTWPDLIKELAGEYPRYSAWRKA